MGRYAGKSENIRKSCASTRAGICGYCFRMAGDKSGLPGSLSAEHFLHSVDEGAFRAVQVGVFFIHDIDVP